MNDEADWARRRAAKKRAVEFFVALGAGILGGVLAFCGTSRASACTPDPLGYPTPVISWVHSLARNCDSTACEVAPGDYDRLDGFRIYARLQNGPFNEVWNLRCWTGDDGIKRCRNTFPVQRGGPWDLQLVDFAVTAYSDSLGESPLSTPLPICMPHIWRCCEEYQ